MMIRRYPSLIEFKVVRKQNSQVPMDATILRFNNKIYGDTVLLCINESLKYDNGDERRRVSRRLRLKL